VSKYKPHYGALNSQLGWLNLPHAERRLSADIIDNHYNVIETKND